MPSHDQNQEEDNEFADNLFNLLRSAAADYCLMMFYTAFLFAIRRDGIILSVNLCVFQSYEVVQPEFWFLTRREKRRILSVINFIILLFGLYNSCLFYSATPQFWDVTYTAFRHIHVGMALYVMFQFEKELVSRSE